MRTVYNFGKKKERSIPTMYITIPKRACLATNKLAKETLLSMLPSIPDNEFVILVATGEKVPIGVKNGISNIEAKNGILRNTYKIIETAYPRKLLLENSNWRINSFDPNTRKVCISLFGIHTERLKGDLNFYLDGSTATSPVVGKLLFKPNLSSKTTITTSTNSSTPTLVGSFLTATDDPRIVSITNGDWLLSLFCSESTGHNIRFWFEILEVESNGTSVIKTISSGNYASGKIVSSSIVSPQQCSLYVPATSLKNSISRILIKIYAQTISAGQTGIFLVNLRNNTLSQIKTTLTTPAKRKPISIPERTITYTLPQL